VIKDCPWAN